MTKEEVKKYNQNYYRKKIKENPNYNMEKHQKKNKEEVKKYNQEAHRRRLKENPNLNKEKYQKVKGKENYNKSHNKARNKWNERNPEKRLAHIRAYDNVKIPKGQLCQICGINLATERHHRDYSKPLEVQFLCSDCHRKIHLDTHAQEKEGYRKEFDIQDIWKEGQEKEVDTHAQDEFGFVDNVVNILNGLLKRSYSFMSAVHMINDAHKKFKAKEKEDEVGK